MLVFYQRLVLKPISEVVQNGLFITSEMHLLHARCPLQSILLGSFLPPLPPYTKRPLPTFITLKMGNGAPVRECL